MLLVCCGAALILSCDTHLRKLTGRIFRDKCKIQKQQALVYKTQLKLRGNVEISSTPYDVEGGWKGVLCYRNGGEIISHFDPEKSKILSV